MAPFAGVGPEVWAKRAALHTIALGDLVFYFHHDEGAQHDFV